MQIGFAYGNCDQQACAFDLAHVCYVASLMRLEAPDDLPARSDDSYISIEAAEEQAVGARANTRYFVVLEEGPRLVVAQFDLAHLEEVECFPLRSATCC